MSDMTLFICIIFAVYVTARFARISGENSRKKVELINEQERQRKIDRLYGRE